MMGEAEWDCPGGRGQGSGEAETPDIQLGEPNPLGSREKGNLPSLEGP
jgi:hypothetical protein